MRNITTGFWLDFKRVFSRRVFGNLVLVLLELGLQPLIVAVLVFVAFIHRNDVDPYRLNFLYFSTLYAFWVGLFGACQAINSEVKSGEWCYWVLGMGRNRTTHVLAIGTSCLLFALIQCLVFLVALVALAHFFQGGGANGTGSINHFVDIFVSVPNGKASIDPLHQMNGALWYVLAARTKWACMGPFLFAGGVFALSLLAAFVSGTLFGLFFGSVFREPATSLNIAVGFVVLLGMVSLCGLQGDGEEKVDPLFAPIHGWATVRHYYENREQFASNAVPAEVISYFLPQRYFFNIGRMSFNKDWSEEEEVQDSLRKRFVSGKSGSSCKLPVQFNSSSRDLPRFKAYWTKTKDGINFECQDPIGKWINGWGCDYPTNSTERRMFSNVSEPTTSEMVAFLRKHPEHREGWKVALHRKIFLTSIGWELLPLFLLDCLFLALTLLAVWKMPCYQELR